MMELKEAIEILKLMEKECKNEPDIFAPHKTIYNTPAICDYEHNYKEALQTVISFLSKFQDAEMPKKKEIRPDPYGRNIIHPADEKNIYYNECYDEWLAYYTKKMVEVLDVEKIAGVIHRFNQGLCVKCNELAQAIVKEIDKVNYVRITEVKEQMEDMNKRSTIMLADMHIKHMQDLKYRKRQAIEYAMEKLGMSWNDNRQRLSFYKHFEEYLKNHGEFGY